MNDIVYKNYNTFVIVGQTINIISDETSYGRNTVAEIGDKLYYLGDEGDGVCSAIFAWQEVNGRIITDEELDQVMIDNNI